MRTLDLRGQHRLSADIHVLYWEEVRVGQERRNTVQPADREERRIEAISRARIRVGAEFRRSIT